MLLYNNGGGLRWVRDAHKAEQGAMKPEGQARLELPRNPGCVSTDLCVCAAGCRMHRVRGEERPNGGGSGRRTGGSFLLRCMCAAL